MMDSRTRWVLTGIRGTPVRALRYPEKPKEMVAAPMTPLKIMSQPIGRKAARACPGPGGRARR